MRSHIIPVLVTILYTYSGNGQTNKSFEQKADTLYKTFKYDSASIYYGKAAENYEREKDWILCVKNYRLTCNALIKAAKYDTAWYYSNKALTIAEQYFRENNKEEMFEKSDVFLNMADVNEKKGNYEEEFLQCKKALALTLKTDSLVGLRIAVIWDKTGLAYLNLGKLDSALWFCNNALETRVKLLGEAHIDVAETKSKIGKIYIYKEEYVEALEYYQKSLKICIAALSEQHPDVASIYNDIGVIYNAKGEYEKALEYYQKALKMRTAILGEQHPDVAISYNNIGLVHIDKGDYEKALEYLQKALKIRIATLSEQHTDVAACYNNIGIVYDNIGANDKALEYYQKALKINIVVQGEQNLKVAASYNNIGLVYWNKCDYDKALEYYQKALSICIAALGELHPYVASINNNIGLVHTDKKDYDKALEYLQIALKMRIAAFGDQHLDVANSYNAIGLVYSDEGDYGKALEYLQKSLAIRTSTLGDKHSYVAGGYYNIGSVYLNEENYDKALEYIQKALAIFITALGEQSFYVANSYNCIGEIFSKKCMAIKALQYYQKALMANTVGFLDTSVFKNPTSDKALSQPILLTSLTGKANAFYQLYKNTTNSIRDLEVSLTTYTLAFQLINSMRNSYNIEDTKLLLSEHTKNYYVQAAHVSMEYNRINPSQENDRKAFGFLELGKSATMAAQFNESQARYEAGLSDSLIQVEKDLRGKISYCKTEIANALSNKDGYDTLTVKSLENENFTCSRKLDSLISYFETTYPAYYEMKYAEKSATIPGIQKTLNHNTAVLNYFVGDSTLFIATITDSLYKMEEIPIDSSFKKLVIAYYRNIKMAEPEAFASNSQRIYEKLINPVKGYITGKAHLVIIPDDYLYYLPFETLIDNSFSPKIINDDYSGLNYLIKSHSISYHHSATLWYNSEEEKSKLAANQKMNFIGFAPVFSEENDNGIIISSNLSAIDTTESDLGYRSISSDLKRFNHLPYSKDEVTSIVKLFEKQKREAKAYIYTEANESNFKNNAPEYDIVHISSHGFSNDKEPALSGIVFSQPTDTLFKEDGVLYTGETYNLSLNADLIVLSSCESGLGKLVKGEGLQALSRGFLYAGSPNVIFSLWRALDKPTKDLMVQFYSNVLEGKTYPEALRQAKLKLINDPKTAFPHFWGGFVMVGR